MDHTELIYLAGLFDGEGCISIIKGKSYTHNHKVCPSPRYQLRLQITNTHEGLMQWLQTFGWYIHERKKLLKHRKRCWVAIICDIQARSWLEQMLPYLKVKKDEALLGIQFQEYKTNFTHNHGRNGLSQEILDKMQEIKNQLSELKKERI